MSARLPFDASIGLVAVTQTEHDSGGGISYPAQLFYSYDFALGVGTEVLAIEGGVVHSVVNNVPNGTSMAPLNSGLDAVEYPQLGPGGTGNQVTIYHASLGLYVTYAHLAQGSVPFTVGQTVAQGAVIGETGLTGTGTGPHLHITYGTSVTPWGGSTSAVYPTTSIANGSVAENPAAFALLFDEAGGQPLQEASYQSVNTSGGASETDAILIGAIPIRISMDPIGNEFIGANIGLDTISSDGRFAWFINYDDGIYCEFDLIERSARPVWNAGPQNDRTSLESMFDNQVHHNRTEFTISRTTVDGLTQLSLLDLRSGVSSPVSVSSTGEWGNGSSGIGATISADGHFVYFYSLAGNLVQNDTNNSEDLFVRDMISGETRRVSLAVDGREFSQGVWDSGVIGNNPPITSNDGRFSIFSATHATLPEFPWSYVFLHDSVSGVSSLVSIPYQDSQDFYSSGSRAARQQGISSDGRFVVFTSQTADITGLNWNTDIFVFDSLTSEVELVSRSLDGGGGNGQSGSPAISDDGKIIYFWSDASNIVAGDTNDDADIFAVANPLFNANIDPVGQWNFTLDDPDTLLFSHFALDAYNGNGAKSNFVHAPNGWVAILTTWDGVETQPTNPDGTLIQDYFYSRVSGMQATAYREVATGRVVVAYRGTDDLVELVGTSIPLGVGAANQTDFLRVAADFYSRVIAQDDIDPTDVSFAGHSLGGMLAGFMAGATGSQGMIFASGPHSLMESELRDSLVLPVSEGFLEGAFNYSKLTHVRIEGEFLGEIVKNAELLATVLRIASAGAAFEPLWVNLANIPWAGNPLERDAVLTKWGTAEYAFRMLPLDPLAAGSQSLGAIPLFDEMQTSLKLHAMTMHSLFLHGKVLGLEQFKDVPGFLLALLNDSIATQASEAMMIDGSDYLDAEQMFSNLMLTMHDGRENVVEPLLRHAEQVLTRFVGLDFGPVLKAGLLGPLGFEYGPVGFEETTVPEALSNHLVEMSARALLDEQATYIQAVGLPVTGSVAPWVSMSTGVDVGSAGLVTKGVGDLLDLLERITQINEVFFPVPDTITVRTIEQTDQRSVAGTSGNDLILGARLADGAGVEMNGEDGDDILVGSVGADILNGGNGFNLLLGGFGDDQYFASSSAGAQTIIDDAGGNDTLTVDGHISESGRGIFRFVTDELSFGVGSSGALVVIDSYFRRASLGFDENAQGRIETIIDGSGQTWLPVTMLEQIGGWVIHKVNEAAPNLALLLTMAADAIDEVDLGTVESLQGKVVDILGGGVEDFLRFTGTALGLHQTNLRPGSLIVDVDEDLDGVVDASIRFVGDFTGYGIEIVQDGADSLIRLAAAPEVLYDIFGTASLDDLNGTEQGDRMGGLEGDDLLNGLEGNDSLHGGGGDDWLDGGFGADYMFGGAGHDVYIVDDLGDLVIEFGGDGDDEVWAGISYALSNDVENLLLMGAASISGTGNALANRLTGNAGNNLLVGGGGNDSLDGDEGTDTADYASETAAVRVAINGSSWAEVLVGGVAGGSLRNIENLIGGLGDDFLGGDAQANEFVGGAGNDTFQGNAGMDSLDGGAGSDTASYAEKTAAVSVTLNGASPVEVLVGGVAEDLISNMENIVGGSGGDRLTGDAAGNQFFGGGGHDILVGLAGADQSHGGDGNDYLYMGEGNDIASGNVGVDVLLLDTGDDYGYGGDDTDYIFGGLGNDILVGEGGVDVLQGEAGNDIFDGGAGGDYVYGGTGNDTAYGRDGNDILVMEAGNDTAFGEEGQDYFYMGDGDDNAHGGAGVDVFLGGAGNDTFEGGTGVDYAWGEAGNDAFVIRGSSGVMVVNGFTAGGADDVVRLTADTGITTFARALASSTYYAGMNTTIVTVDADTSVWLVGVNRTQLTAADFVFV